MSAVLFVGTYTQSLGHVDGKGKGIYAFSLDRATGALAPLAVTEGVGHNPSYLTCSRSTLYAVNETNAAPQEEGATKPTGFVKAFAIGDNGALKELNAQEAGGADSCHVALSPAGDFLTVANYSGGNLRMYPIDATDGSLGAPSDTHTFSGASMAVPDRQEAAHVHSTTWLTRKSDGAHTLIAADLGNDVAAQFVLNKAARKLEPNGAVPFAKRPAGSGPRHFAVHAALQVAYVLDELSSTVGVHPIDATTGALSLESIQTVSMLPADFKGQTLGADIHVSTCGQFLYASNRGHDSIAGFRIDAAKQGALTPIGFTSTRGKAPRAFRIDGHWLLAANQNSDTIEVFQIDAQTGALTFTGHSVACPTPVSLAIVPSA